MKTFLSRVFHSENATGNLASVVICSQETELADTQRLQSLARELNTPATAFVWPEKVLPPFPCHIRWFSPTSEIQLCGHGTLAAADVLQTHFQTTKEDIAFFKQDAQFKVSQLKGGHYALHLENQPLKIEDDTNELEKVVGIPLVKLASSLSPDGYYVAELATREEVDQFTLPEKAYSAFTQRALIITSYEKEIGQPIYFRYFAPQYGEPEDTATGSAGPLLATFWQIPRDTEIPCIQLSKGGGVYSLYRKGNFTHVVARVSTYEK